MPAVDFWKGKRVLLTGHTGFKGAWLALWLNEMGADVLGVALEPENERGIFQSARIDQLMTSVIQDIRDLPPLQKIVQDYNPDILFHLAAQPLVRLAHKDPVGTFSTNMMGTVNILEAVRGCDALRAAIMVTSDKVYENHDTGADYVESDPVGGKEAYGTSKACCELLVNAYRHMLKESNPNMGIATARAGNVIGGGDWAEDRLVPDAMRTFTGNLPLIIRNPLSTRPWQHVLMPLEGYLLLAEKLAANAEKFEGGWNFGPTKEDAIPVGQLADLIVEQWNAESDGNASWEQDKGHHPYEAKLLSVDSEKARVGLSWNPTLDVYKGLSMTVDWYRAQNNGMGMRGISLDQIRKIITP